MKKRIGFVALGLIALSLVAVRSSKALQVERGPAEFGLIGVAASETARLNAFCPSDPSIPPGPCDVTFAFLDIQGRTLEQTTLTLLPNTGGFLDLRPVEIGSASIRLTVLARINVTRGGAIATLEVFDDGTGRTSIFSHPGTVVLPAVQ
jgi:hypothetical protein